MKKFIAAMALLMGNTACTHLNSVSLTQIPKERKKIVSADRDRWIILGLNFDNDYATDVSRTLAEKCPNGQIKGILTKDEFTNYFLFLVVKRNVSARGYCIQKDGKGDV